MSPLSDQFSAFAALAVLRRSCFGHQQFHGTGSARGAERDLYDNELHRKVDIPPHLLCTVRIFRRRRPPFPVRLPLRLFVPRPGQIDGCLHGMEPDMR